jgi:hypothetical protein
MARDETTIRRRGQSGRPEALTFGGLSIAFATFLILEFGMPRTGLFRVAPAALEQTIQFMDR